MTRFPPEVLLSVFLPFSALSELSSFFLMVCLSSRFFVSTLRAEETARRRDLEEAFDACNFRY